MQHRQTHTLAIFGSSRCVAPYADGLKRILKTRALADAFRCYHLRIAIDFLIIGQGLAGTVLAWNLIQRGRSVIVLDREDESTSSKVAAGLINPFVGMPAKIIPLRLQQIGRATRRAITVKKA